MPWRGVTIMGQRVRFISEYLEGYFRILLIPRNHTLTDNVLDFVNGM